MGWGGGRGGGSLRGEGKAVDACTYAVLCCGHLQSVA